MNLHHFVLFLLNLSLFLGSGYAEWYTALADMEELLQSEHVLYEMLNKYINQQENTLKVLKEHARKYITEHDDAFSNPDDYLSNPLNAYRLVKRLTIDWSDTLNIMKRNLMDEITKNSSNNLDLIKLPENEDLNGAAVALLRLQDTYRLNTTSVARGELNGVKYSTQLTVEDCFELGRQSYYNEDYYHTTLWMNEALDRYNENSTLERWQILEYLAYTTYLRGDIQRAYLLNEELLKGNPTHERALGNRQHYKLELEKELENNKNVRRNMADRIRDATLENRGKKDLTERMKYEILCRNEIQLPVDVLSQLKCRYTHNNNPFLLIAPLKEEEAYLKPKIILYRNVIYPTEIEVIKKMARPKFRRATVQNYKTGELEVANYRISKSAWLRESDHPVIKAISDRVEDMTGLTTSTAEELQVVNYGIGGHYEPHFDFARKEETNAFKSLGTGNRIATVLFYMSDVAQGGATVFTHLNVTLWPSQGTAAFWYNLHSDGTGDYSTRHAACPVLQGSKWVSNKWLHQKGQELSRPCTNSDRQIDDGSQ